MLEEVVRRRRPIHQGRQRSADRPAAARSGGGHSRSSVGSVGDRDDGVAFGIRISAGGPCRWASDGARAFLERIAAQRVGQLEGLEMLRQGVEPSLGDGSWSAKTARHVHRDRIRMRAIKAHGQRLSSSGFARAVMDMMR